MSQERQDKSPKPRIEVGEADSGRPAADPVPLDETPQGEGAPQADAAGVAAASSVGGSSTGQPASDSKADSGCQLASWLARTLPGHQNAVLGGLAGLVVALLLFWIGLFKTLVIVVLVLVGVACGQLVDGDPKLVRIVQRLMKKR